MDANAAQLTTFHERIARIEARQRAGKRVYHVGDTQMEASKLRGLPAEAAARPRRRRGRAMGTLLALATGAVAVVIARLATAWWADASLTGQQSQQALLADLGLAAFLALVLRALLGLRWGQFMTLQLPAAAVMVLCMHNLVHMAPDAFGKVFPEKWVDTVLSSTAPHSVLVPDGSITF